MALNASNNFGIGTIDPIQKLHVKGIGCIEDASSTDFGTLQFGTNTLRYIRGNSAELQVGATIQQLHFQKTNGPAQVASSAADGVTAIQLLARNVHTSANLLEVVNGNGQTADFVIDSDGKVGIGTTGPTQKLTVAGSMDTVTAMGVAGQWASSQIRLETTNTVDTTGWQGISFDASTTNNYGWSIGVNRSGSGRGSFRFYEHINSATGAERFTIEQDGNVLSLIHI